jgi:hypothetical protein
VNFDGVITGLVADALHFDDLEVRLTPTTIVGGGTTDDLLVGARVVVEGRIQTLGRIEATRIAIR